jgi:hypothetical protein
MLILDDVLLFPVRSILWIFREIYNASQQELETEADVITVELSELYMMLETGKITESEFDAEERILLDRLDEIQGHGNPIEENNENEGYN